MASRAEIYDEVDVKYLNTEAMHNINTDSSIGTTFKDQELDVGDLTDMEQRQLIHLLQDYADSFSSNTADLGCTNLVEMTIETTTDKPIHFKPYRLSHKERQVVDTKVQELLDAGIVRESNSAYASPVVLVRKKEWRIQDLY